MRLGMTALTIVAGFLFTPTSPLFAQNADPLVGKQVMVARWNAELKVGAKTIATLPLGSLITVTKVNGGWLWVERSRGWIQRSQVTPADQAIAHFTSAIGSNPSAEAYHQRAVAYAALKQFDKALADLNAVIARDSRNVGVYNDRGNAYRNLGRPKQAIADFDRVIASNVRHPAVYTNRGLAWYDSKNYDRALADFNAALAIDAKFAHAWEAGGSARQAKGEHDAAIRNFKEAVKLNPKYTRALNNLAWILSTCHHGDHLDGKQAVVYATQACELTNYKDAGMLDTLAASLAEAGKFDDAVKRATEALALADASRKKAISERLALYKTRKPFRDAPLGQ